MEIDFNNLIPELRYYIHRKCTPKWKIEPDIIDFVDITYVIDGKALYTIGDRQYLLKKGDLICIPYGTYRAAVPVLDDLMECYGINILLRNMKGENVNLPIPLITHIGIDPKLISLFHGIRDEWLQKNFGYMLKIRGMLSLILHQVLNLILNENWSCQNDPRIKNSINYISSHYAEPLTIQMMAERFNLHPVYFGSLFRKTMGVSFKQYLLQIRLNNAEGMLQSGEYSVGEVAALCGFSDVFYFSRVFKEKKRIVPSDLFPPERKKGRE